MKKKWTISIICCIVVVIFLALGGVGLYHVSTWLQTGDTPSQADAIIVLAGGPFRAFYAADLYIQGYAKVLYVSKATREPWEKNIAELGISFIPQEEIYLQVLRKKGVPQDQITFFGRSLSTVQEAEHIRNIFNGQDCKLLVVTSPYHVRRTRMIFSDTIPNCQIAVVGTPYESFPARWWNNQEAARNVLLELSKIIFYMIGGSFKMTLEEQRAVQ